MRSGQTSVELERRGQGFESTGKADSKMTRQVLGKSNLLKPID